MAGKASSQYPLNLFLIRTSCVFLFQFIFILLSVFSQLLIPEIQTFTLKDLEQAGNAMASPQFFEMQQDVYGNMYFSNLYSVWMYNGKVWSYLPMESGNVQSITYCKNTGKLFVANGTAFGCLDANEQGKLFFRQISLPPLGYVNKVVAGEDGRVYVRGDSGIVAYQSGSGSAEFVARGNFSLHFSAGEVWAYQKSEGIFRMKAPGEIYRHPDFPDEELRYCRMLEDGGLLLAFHQRGFMVLRDELLTDWPPVSTWYAHQNTAVNDICETASGQLILATEHQGLIVVDEEQGELMRLGQADGLPGNFVNKLFYDHEGHLWAGFNEGIAKISFPSAYSYAGQSRGYEGIILDIQDYDGKLYIATTQGVYELIHPEPGKQPAGRNFRQISNIPTFNYDLENTPAGLLVASDDGIYTISGSKGSRIYHEEAYPLVIKHSVRSPGIVYAGFEDGVARFATKNGKLTMTGRLKTDYDINRLEEDLSGSLWAASANKEVILRIDPEENFEQSDVLTFDSSDGVSGVMQVLKADGEVFFGSWYGLLRFDDKSRKFIPDETLGDGLAFVSEKGPMIYRMTSASDRYWVVSEKLVSLDAEKPDERDTVIFAPITNSEIRAIHADSKHIIWLGSDEGLVRIDPGISEKSGDIYYTLITGVYLGDSILSYGPHLHDQNEVFPELGHHENALAFDFAAVTYTDPSLIRYSYYLEGLDEGWGSWTKKSEIQYTNLDPGEYVFHVRSKNIYGIVSHEATFGFRIIPPFYQTWWFSLLQVIIVILLFAIAIAWARRGKSRKTAIAIGTVALFIVFEYMNNYVEDHFEAYVGRILFLKVFLNVLIALTLIPLERLVSRLILKRARPRPEAGFKAGTDRSPDKEKKGAERHPV